MTQRIAGVWPAATAARSFKPNWRLATSYCLRRPDQWDHHSWTLRSNSELADFQEKLNKHLQSWSRVRVYQDETGLQCQYWTGDTSLLKKLRSGPGRLMVALIGLLGGLGFCIQSAGSWQDLKGEPIWLIFLLIFPIAALALAEMANLGADQQNARIEDLLRGAMA